jgi:ankyrin repeat protein
MNYKQKILKKLVKHNDKQWLRQWATAELLNSNCFEGTGDPFALELFRYDLSPCMVHTLITQGLNIGALRDKHGDNCIHYYIRYHANSHVISLLVEHGADINARGYHERTPLIQALCSSYGPKHKLCVVEALLTAGADVTVSRHGRTIMEITLGVHQGELYVGLIRCQMAKDAFVVCAKKHGVSRDMINLIGRMIWETRMAGEWWQQNKCTK